MEFEVTHTTSFRYTQPAAEAYGEARLTPRDRPGQHVISHRLSVEPDVRLSSYDDHFGNRVDFFSLPFRHQRLSIVNHMLVRTERAERPREALEIPVQEARQILTSTLTDVFDYLQPTPVVETGREAVNWARRFLRGDRPLGRALEDLNHAIHAEFRYQSGSTENSTPLAVVWKQKRGVCQDFAHIGLSILRTAGLPARYVCGYIETDPPAPKPGEAAKPGRRRALTGAVATHAWIEVLVPGMEWVSLDPTNKQWTDDRYIAVSYGRDYRDASPLRGTFKGSGGQTMKVRVTMKRRKASTSS